MKQFKIFINETEDETKALVEITNNNTVVLQGDYYHDKIDEMIEGFFIGLDYCEVEYEMLNEERISPEHNLFDVIGFYDNN